METPEAKVKGSVFDPNLLILSLSGRRLSLSATLKLTEALRGALMAACPKQPPPEWFSGHAADGRPSREPHLALFPLPFVGAERADGRVKGLGLALPVGLDPMEVAGCLAGFLHETNSGLPRATRLFDGKWFECVVEPETRESPPMSLRVQPWVRASFTWASVTPVVLDRHHDGADKWMRAAEDIKDACERIGLPRPREVLLHPVSLIEGVPHAREFPPMVRKSDGGRRHHSHAVIVFDEAVRGPVLIGAGRFRGYGLFRPADQGRSGT
jgi:CRISPR-associated protein Csb2